MDASLGPVDQSSHGRAPLRLIHACEGARGRRPPPLLRRRRRPAARRAHGRRRCRFLPSRSPTRSTSSSIDRSHFVLDVVRTLFTSGLRRRRRAAAREPRAAAARRGRRRRARRCRCRSTRRSGARRCSQRQLPDNQIIGAILSDRSTALLYHGLAGLDDETLAWLGPERETLRHLLRHAGAFASSDRACASRRARSSCPAARTPSRCGRRSSARTRRSPAAFVRRLFGDESGVLAWFYDAIAHLDAPRLRFALGASLPAAARVERVRALLDVFERVGSEWQPEKQPFSRRPFDPALTLAVIEVERGRHACRARPARALGARFRATTRRRQMRRGRPRPVDASRRTRSGADRRGVAPRPASIACRSMSGAGASTTFLFAQRVFAEQRPRRTRSSSTRCARTARFPSLMLTLERARRDVGRDDERGGRARAGAERHRRRPDADAY